MSSKTVSIFLLLLLSGFVFASCDSRNSGTDVATTQTAHQENTSLSRTFALKCTESGSAENQLALELSKKCRQDNAALKAKGLPSCGEDYCSEAIALETEFKGLEVEFAYDGGEVEFLVTLSSNFALPQHDKQALICFAPVIKARELLTTAGAPCH